MASVSSTTSLISSSLSSTTATTASSSSSSTSDIDWNALITLAVDAKLAKADSVDLKITANEAKIASYQSMQTLLGDVTTAANSLRAASGTSNASSNIFTSRTAYLTASDGTSTSSALAATVESGAAIGSHEIVVEQVAKAHKVAGSAIASKSTDLSLDGTISLGTGENLVSITITADMSLSEIVEAINGTTESSGVQASLLSVSGTDHRIVLTAVETGLPITAADNYGDTVLQTLGIVAEDGSFANQLQAAQSAILQVDGLTITRTSNDIDDVIEGVTLHVYATTSASDPLTLEVGTDLASVKEAIVALVDAYNAYREFAYAQQQIPTSSNAETTVLFGDGTLRAITNQLAEAISSRIGDTGMSLLGLSFDSTNQLVLDETVLDAALLGNLDEIEDLLSFQFTASTTNLMLLARGTTDLGSFTLDVTTDSSGALVSAGVEGDDSLFTVNGTRIIGKTGTAYEGYTFVYAGTTSQSIAITTQTGLAELLYNAAKGASDTASGTLATVIGNLEDYNIDLQAKSDDIRSRAETYQTNLTALYARYQAAIETAESSLDYLTTLIDTWNSSS
ncbi:MAG: flagellar filament capping protein FliD [Candidatus Devosia phytovorans]|uniref:Flagellar hook-associated protein 2 n=1 Tax=Candidatus Devosia phytovorans TaxID=3121372 RepID=A0AAJ5VR93_9HYPH|nr:flagellar filament capping protein FliD [Devosia sp.]WEK03296.1 MAG: flagellar filament capping protein FliD [Devosia sp.]